MSGGSNYHSFHHTNNKGNYGAITHFMDTLFGTDQKFIKAQPDKALYVSKRKNGWLLLTVFNKVIFI